jgi:predicted Zn-dependent protease
MSEGSSAIGDSRPEENLPGQALPDGDVHAWYRRGMELLDRGSPAAAAQVLQRASAAEPASRSVREALARAQFDAGRYAEAADNFRVIVEASPSDDYAHFGLGLALARTGDPAAAAEYLALASAMRPDAAHYTEALRSVRATLRAREDARLTDRDGIQPGPPGGIRPGPPGGIRPGPPGGIRPGPPEDGADSAR